MKPKVSIIIVNWNGLAHLQDCLGSLEDQTCRDFEVILVDNGSEDNSKEFVQKNYPWVKIVALNENTGFATGNNLGLEQAQGEYIITLNNDTRVEPDWLEHLVRAADNHPRAGMVASRICSFDESDIIDSVGMGICPDGMSRGRYRNRRWSSLHLQDVEEIFFPSACAALYKRAMMEETGFFDDDFFAFAEDSDLGLRGRLAGWEAIAATRAVVLHKYSQTTGRLSPFKVFLVERNHYWVVWKNFPLKCIFFLPFYSFWRYLEQIRTVLGKKGAGGEFRASSSQWQLITAQLKGLLAGIGGIPRMFVKRRRLMKIKRLPARRFSELLRQYRITFRELLDHD